MNSKNEDIVWDAYNSFLLSPDTERLRKTLVCSHLFQKSLTVPGDIVECGVFKGSSLMLFLKILHIFASGSAKRVIGFDMFDYFPVDNEKDIAAVEAYISKSNFKGVLLERSYEKVNDTDFSGDKCELIAGDIRQTAPDYMARYLGFRISLLNLDLDIDEPTFAALEAFWPRVVPDGIVIIDEYAIRRWSESQAIDRFFADKHFTLKTLTWAKTPTAYIVKR
jgi:hypothetical protein